MRFFRLAVFVVGGDAAERFVLPDFVVVDADACRLCVGQRRVGDVVDVEIEAALGEQLVEILG